MERSTQSRDGIRFVAIIGITVTLFSQVAKSDEATLPEKPIGTTAAVKMLPAKAAELHLPVELHGVVTGVPEGWKGFFLEDETGGIYCEPRNVEAEKSFWPLRVGEKIHLQGVTSPGHRNSFVAVTHVVSREEGSLPEPKKQTIRDVIAKGVDADFVRVRGHIVGLVNIAGEMEYGLLADGIEAQVVHAGFRIDPKVYELAEVEISGIVIPQETEARLAKIVVPSAQCFRMVATHSDVLAATPATSIRDTLHHRESDSPIVRVSGDIFGRDSEKIWLEENRYSIGWRSRGVLLPEEAKHVDLLGVLKRDGVRSWIDYGTVLATTNLASNTHQAEDADSSELDAEVNQITTVTATFWDANSVDSEIVLSFDAGNSKLTCRLLTGSDSSMLPELRRGAEYQVTGLLNAVSLGNLETRELLVRSVSDIVQVSGPPWPLRFTLTIVSILSVGLALGLITTSISWRQSSLARQRLETARIELRNANETLEARVASRTEELHQLNRQLVDEANSRLLVEHDRKRTLACLEEAQSLAQIGSFSWDAATNSSIWSKQCYLIHGIDPSELAPNLQEYCEHVAETDRESFELYLKRSTNTPEKADHRYRILTSDGDVRWLRAIIGATRDPDGSLTSLDGIIQDVTDLVSTEEQLRHSMKMEVAGRLAGGIAHDLNNTLTIIQLNCFLLNSELQALHVKRDILNHVVAIENASEKSAMLTKQLLTFSRKQIVRPVELNINSSILTFRPLLTQLLDDSIHLDVQFGEKIADVRLDPGHLEQILMNLVLNARDAIAGRGQIQVKTENVSIDQRTDTSNWAIPPKIGEYVSIRITDNGTGIAPASLHAIFEPFFSTKEPDKGTGLGLAVVHGIVRQCHGGLLVESEENHGTTFQVLIPAVRQADGSVASTEPRIDEKLFSQPLSTAPAKYTSILLVDDEAAVGSYTKQVLTRLGYSVTIETSAKDAIRSVKNGQQFQLLITDYSMPNMSGTELAKQIREYLPRIPVILMSGFLNEEAFRSLTVELNPTYVQKPFTIQSLAAAVRTLLSDNESVPRAAG